jgi:membrane fusion protein (multidrug efflux system)
MQSNSVLAPKYWIWLVGSVGALVVLCIAISNLAAKPVAKALPPPEVEVASVRQSDVSVYREWIGTLAGHVNADIKAQVTGYVVARSYKEGSFVRRGQLLFEIDPRPFQAALDRAEGELAQAQAKLLQNEAQLATARANQLRSLLDVEKYTPLAEASAVSKQALDDAVQTDTANKAQVQAANAAIAATKAEIQADQAAVRTAAINLGFTHITSPIDGIAGIAQAQVGNLVSPESGVLTTVSTLNPIRDYFAVSEQEYLEIRNRLANADVNRWKLQLVLADGTTYSREGWFFFADRQVNQNTGTIQLTALFPNPGNALRPGQYGRVRAVVRVDRGAMVIPQAAVNQQQGKYFVDVIGADNRVAVRPVQVGEPSGTMWVIQKGLKPGERVVVQCQQTLRPGMLVHANPFIE